LNAAIGGNDTIKVEEIINFSARYQKNPKNKIAGGIPKG